MKLWVIEDRDSAGLGLFITNSASRNGALRKWRKNGGVNMKLVTAEQVDWIHLAEVTGTLGETSYKRVSQS